MTKHEAFASGQFERLEVTSVASTASGQRWAQGFITYRRYAHEHSITEDFQWPVSHPDIRLGLRCGSSC